MKKNNKKVKNKKSKDKKSTIRKLGMTACIFTLCFLGIMANLGRILVVHGKEYSESAYNNQMKNQILSPKRGKIYDVNGNILAMSVPVETISINPGKVAYSNKKSVKNETLAQGLATTLELDYNEVLEKVNKKSSVVVIAKKVSEEKAENLKNWMNENKITSGINIDKDTKRYYPNNTIASNLIGICNDDNVGTIGIENRWNSTLTGTAGKIVTMQDVNKNPISDETEQYVPVENGRRIWPEEHEGGRGAESRSDGDQGGRGAL